MEIIFLNKEMAKTFARAVDGGDVKRVVPPSVVKESDYKAAFHPWTRAPPPRPCGQHRRQENQCSEGCWCQDCVQSTYSK